MDIKKKLLADIRRADFDFGLINKGDKIMVGVSGGKDSMALLYLLSIYQKFTDKDFDFTGVMLDLGFPKNNLEPIFKFAKENKIDFRVVDATNVYPILKQHMKGDQLPCSICSRMKKAAINRVANELGFKKVTFAHHNDDAIETLIMNMTHGGRLATFSPKMFLKRAQIEFIRPLIYAREKDIISFVKEYNIPIIKSTCTNDKTSQRALFKKILANHYSTFPDSYDNFSTMLTNIEHEDLWFNMLGYNDGNGFFYHEAYSAKDYQYITFIRSKVFLEEQKIDPKDEFGEADFDYKYYLVTKDNNPVGTLRIKNIDENNVKIERFCILKEYRNQGIGSSLLHYVEKKLSQKHTPIAITLDAQKQAIKFYENNGYKQNSNIFLEAGIEHIKMFKNIDHPLMDKAKKR